MVAIISSVLSWLPLLLVDGQHIQFGSGGSALLRAGVAAGPNDEILPELAIQLEPKISMFRQTRRGSLTTTYNNLIRLDLLRIWSHGRPPVYHQLALNGDRKLSRAWNSVLQISGGFGELDYANQNIVFINPQSERVSSSEGSRLSSAAAAEASLILSGKVAPRHSLSANLTSQYSNLANPDIKCGLQEQFAQGRQQAGGTIILGQQSIVSRKDSIGSGASFGAFYFDKTIPMPLVGTAYVTWQHRWTSESTFSLQTGAAVLSSDRALNKKHSTENQYLTGVAQFDISTVFYSSRDLRLQGQWSAGISPFVDPISARAAPRLLTSSGLTMAIRPKWNASLIATFAAPIDIAGEKGERLEDFSTTANVNPRFAPYSRFGTGGTGATFGAKFGDPPPPVDETPVDETPIDETRPNGPQDPQDPNPQDQIASNQQQSIISVDLNFNYLLTELISINWGATLIARGSSLNNLRFSSRQFDLFGFGGINFAITTRGRRANWLR